MTKQTIAIPHKSNFCGGNFQDWLEVYLYPNCNGRCKWCIDKHGYRPKDFATPYEICQAALESGAKNVILLGGEPTLYPHLQELIDNLTGAADINVFITTNGSTLDESFINENLAGLTGINISIHDYLLTQNAEITGIKLYDNQLITSILDLKNLNPNISVRFNCNIISGHVDRRSRINAYIRFAKTMGADSVRFAELKGENGEFVSLLRY